MPRSRLLLAATATALLALGLLGSACGGDDEESTDAAATAAGTASTAATARVAGTATGAGASSPLTAVNDSFSKVKSFRATIALEAGGQTQTGTIESVQPDRIHITILGLEIISIGADSWIKTGATWTKQAGTGFGGFQSPDVQGTIKSFTGPGVVASGTDTVNGKRCDVFTTPATAGASSVACVADGLPLRVVTQSAQGKTTVVFTDYNADIKIEAPN